MASCPRPASVVLPKNPVEEQPTGCCLQQRGVGDVDIPVTFGGVTFTPGDWLYADEDGVIVSAAPLL